MLEIIVITLQQYRHYAMDNYLHSLNVRNLPMTSQPTSSVTSSPAGMIEIQLRFAVQNQEFHQLPVSFYF